VRLFTCTAAHKKPLLHITARNSTCKVSLVSSLPQCKSHNLKSTTLTLTFTPYKWDGKITKIWYDNEMRWIRVTAVKWRRFIVPKKVEQINDHLFIDTYKSNNLQIGWMIWRWLIAKCVWDEKTKPGQYRRCQSWDSLGKYRLRRKGKVKEMGKR